MTTIVPERYLLAGHMERSGHEDLTQRYEKLFEEAKTTAKDVHIAKEPILPWQHDTQGKYFSTHGETLNYEIKWLEKYYSKIGEDDSKAPEQIAVQNLLVTKKLEQAVRAKESKFQKNLKRWIMGEGKAKEYNPKICWWITGDEYNELKELEPALEKLREHIKREDPNLKFYANEFYQQTMTDQVRITQRLIRNFPNLTRGCVDKQNDLRIKYQQFLQMLSKIAPRTEEEAYLFYKYLINETDPLAKMQLYLDNPEYQEFPSANAAPRLPTPPDKIVDDASSQDTMYYSPAESGDEVDYEDNQFRLLSLRGEVDEEDIAKLRNEIKTPYKTPVPKPVAVPRSMPSLEHPDPADVQLDRLVSELEAADWEATDIQEIRTRLEERKRAGTSKNRLRATLEGLIQRKQYKFDVINKQLFNEEIVRTKVHQVAEVLSPSNREWLQQTASRRLWPDITKLDQFLDSVKSDKDLDIAKRAEIDVTIGKTSSVDDQILRRLQTLETKMSREDASALYDDVEKAIQDGQDLETILTFLNSLEKKKKPQ